MTIIEQMLKIECDERALAEWMTEELPGFFQDIQFILGRFVSSYRDSHPTVALAVRPIYDSQCLKLEVTRSTPPVKSLTFTFNKNTTYFMAARSDTPGKPLRFDFKINPNASLPATPTAKFLFISGRRIEPIEIVIGELFASILFDKGTIARWEMANNCTLF